MRSQPFEAVRELLLEPLERLVVADHAALHRDRLGEEWSPPAAYRWIRYEDPAPIDRLLDATRRLEAEWVVAGGRPMGARGSERTALVTILAAARSLGYLPRSE